MPSVMASPELRKPRLWRKRTAATALSAVCNWERGGRLRAACNTVPERGSVGEKDGGEGGKGRVEDIGCVKAAAETYFEDGKFHALAGEVFKGHGRDALEVGGMRSELACGEKSFGQGVDSSKSLREGIIANLFAMEADALVDSFQMRRRVQPGSKAGTAQDRFEKCSRRTLPVRAGDVSAGVGAIRAAEALGNDGDVLEVELHGRCLRWSSQFPSKCEQITNRCV